MTTKHPLIPVLAAAFILLSTDALWACICMGPPNFDQSFCSPAECDRRAGANVGLFDDQPEVAGPSSSGGTGPDTSSLMACMKDTCYSPCLSCSIYPNLFDPVDPATPDPRDTYTLAPCPIPYAAGLTCYYLNGYNNAVQCGTPEAVGVAPCEKQKEEEEKKAAEELAKKKIAEELDRLAQEKLKQEQEESAAKIDAATCGAAAFDPANVSCQKQLARLLDQQKECEKTPAAPQCKEVEKTLAEHKNAAKGGDMSLLSLKNTPPPDDPSGDEDPDGNESGGQTPDLTPTGGDPSGEDSLSLLSRAGDDNAGLLLAAQPNNSDMRDKTPAGAPDTEIADPSLDVAEVAMSSVESAEFGWRRIDQLGKNLGAMESTNQAARAAQIDQNSGGFFSLFSEFGSKVVSGVAAVTGGSDDTKLLTPVPGGLIMKENDGT